MGAWTLTLAVIAGGCGEICSLRVETLDSLLNSLTLLVDVDKCFDVRAVKHGMHFVLKEFLIIEVTIAVVVFNCNLKQQVNAFVLIYEKGSLPCTSPSTS